MKALGDLNDFVDLMILLCTTLTFEGFEGHVFSLPACYVLTSGRFTVLMGSHGYSKKKK